MSDHIKIRKADGTWVVRVRGAVIAESENALELTEGSYPSVIYFPRDDIAMPFLEASTKSTHCPHKGDAVYFDIESKSATLKNAAWSYETPLESVERIANHVAFYDGEATVEQL